MTIAIFDLDNTLLDGDSESMWSDFLFENKIVDEIFVSRIAAYFDEYEKGRLDLFPYESYLMSSIKLIPEEELNHFRGLYLDRIRNVIRPVLVDILEQHRSQNHELLLITAANNFLAQPIAKILEFRHLICTQIDTRYGENTGKIIGTPAYRDGKTVLLKKWLIENGQTLKDSWGYSDSHNDLPILSMVQHPVAVVPDDILRAHAILSGWKIIEK